MSWNRGCPGTGDVLEPGMSGNRGCRGTGDVGEPGTRAAVPGSAEAAGDVVLGGLLARVGEDLLGVVDLDQPARLALGLQVEEAGLEAQGKPGRLVEVDDTEKISTSLPGLPW